MILLFLIHGILTIISFIILLSISDLPGGAVGMTPFLVMILVLVQFIVGTIGFVILRKRMSSKRQRLFLLLGYSMIYWIILYFGMKDYNFHETLLDSIDGGLNRRYYLTNLISTIIVLGIFKWKEIGYSK